MIARMILPRKINRVFPFDGFASRKQDFLQTRPVSRGVKKLTEASPNRPFCFDRVRADAEQSPARRRQDTARIGNVRIGALRMHLFFGAVVECPVALRAYTNPR